MANETMTIPHVLSINVNLVKLIINVPNATTIKPITGENTNTVPDIIINAKILVKEVPSTTLLGLESKIKQWREVLDSVPTLPPGTAWERDDKIGKDVYRRKHPEEKFRTAKTFKHTVLVPPTDKHPAQIEKWQEDVNVGKYITESWSGMLTPT